MLIPLKNNNISQKKKRIKFLNAFLIFAAFLSSSSFKIWNKNEKLHF
jgi:hypothetical protein